jgi:predicted nuclease with TOPRIM domain
MSIFKKSQFDPNMMDAGAAVAGFLPMAGMSIMAVQGIIKHIRDEKKRVEENMKKCEEAIEENQRKLNEQNKIQKKAKTISFSKLAFEPQTILETGFALAGSGMIATLADNIRHWIKIRNENAAQLSRLNQIEKEYQSKLQAMKTEQLK